MRKILILFAFAAFAAVSANSQTVINGKWKLVSMENDSRIAANITLNIERSKIGGNGGCNSFGGNFSRKGTKVKISDIISTQMWCDNGGIEKKYFDLLRKSISYRIKSGRLYLIDQKREEILIFEKAK